MSAVAQKRIVLPSMARSPFGGRHRITRYDEARIDYFAVSLPDLQLFDEDLSLRNRAHCEYLIGLGSYGLGDTAAAARSYEAVLSIDASHQGALLHKALLG